MCEAIGWSDGPVGHGAAWGGLLLEYSIPSIIGMVMMSLYNIVDRIFIGQGVGPLAFRGWRDFPADGARNGYRYADRSRFGGSHIDRAGNEGYKMGS